MGTSHMTQQVELLLDQDVDVDLSQRLFLKSIKISTPKHCIKEVPQSNDTVITRHVMKLFQK